MKTKAIWEKKYIEYREGNKILAYFMGDFSTKLFQDNTSYYDDYAFTESWDAIMAVVAKIKEYTYSSGYGLFSHEHKAYTRIGNACYDCDIYQTWLACVRWCLNYFSSSKRFDIITEEDALISVSPKAVECFRTSVLCVPEIEVKKILLSPEQLSKYRIKGDGVYEIEGFDDVFCVLKDNLIVRVHTADDEDKSVSESALSFIEKFRVVKN